MVLDQGLFLELVQVEVLQPRNPEASFPVPWASPFVRKLQGVGSASGIHRRGSWSGSGSPAAQ